MNARDYLDIGWRGDPGDIVAAGEVAPGELLRRLIPAAPAWHAGAACQGVDVAVFFPPLGGTGREALELCGLCPVRLECLAEALADPSLDHGIRGGMSARARAAHRRLAARRDVTPRAAEGVAP